MAQQVWKDLGGGCLLEFCCLEKIGNLASQMVKVEPLWEVSLWTEIGGCGGTEAEQQLECLIGSRPPSSGTQRPPSPLLQRSSRQQVWTKQSDLSLLHEGFNHYSMWLNKQALACDRGCKAQQSRLSFLLKDLDLGREIILWIVIRGRIC